MTVSSEAAAEGSKVTMTCNYEQYSGSGTPKLEWFKDTTAFTEDQKKLLSAGDSCGDTQRERYIIASTTTANTGKYKCKATYTIDSKPVVLEPTKEISFYVRKLTTDKKVYHVEVGGSVDIVCTVAGEEPAVFKWTLSTGEVLPGGITETPSAHKVNAKTNTLKITTAAEATHQKSFKCQASWTSAFEPKALDATVELKVYGELKYRLNFMPR